MLWFDLMFDVQVRRRGRESGPVPEPRLASIAAYYARVTTAARPMNRLIAATMLALLAALVVQLAQGDAPTWVSLASLALAVGAIGLAGAHTVGAAVRLGTRADDLETQSRLARAIYRDHVICFAAIAGVLAIQLAFAA